jgi:protein TonB
VSKAEGEVDRLIRELREKGESVYGRCAEGEDCKPIPGTTLELGEPVSRPEPAYPAIARAARAQGEVRVLVAVDEEGKVIAAQAVSGHPLLQFAAVKAARQVLFKPALLNGKPVKISGVLSYNFSLQY